MRGLFCTTAPLTDTHGGGNVSLHELNALKKVCSTVEVRNPENTPHLQISPFHFDKAVATLLKPKLPFNLVHFNGNPFRETLKTLRKTNPNIRVSCSVPAHDLEASIAEHHLENIPYENLYPHMVQPELWTQYTEHIIQSDMVIYPSEMSRDYLVKKLNLDNLSLLIPHGCDFPEEPPPFPSVFKPGYVGALGPDKGVKYLVQAWERMEKAGAQLGFFGREAELAPYLLRHHGVFDHARYAFHGAYSNWRYVAKNLSLLIHPSVTEGFGITVLEAMAHARPVAVSRGAGVSELITPNHGGYLFNPRDVNEILEIVSYFTDNLEEAEYQGLKGRKKAEEFRWEMIEERYVNVFRRLLD